MRYKYDAADNLRFTQDANGTTAGTITYTGYDAVNRPVREGMASVSFSSVDPDTQNTFETEQANLHGVWAYDAKPSTAVFPWSKFTSQLDSFTPSNPKGNLVAQA